MVNLILLLAGAFLITIFSVLTGGGASLLYMPLIAYTIGVRSVAPVMALGIGISSTSRVFYFWKDIDWNLFKWLFPSTIIGSILGARLFAELSSDYLQILIGLFLVSTIFQVKGKKEKVQATINEKEEARKGKPVRRFKTWYFVPMGFVVAFLSGLIGGVGPLMNSAYLNYGMTKEELIATRSANAVLLHITKIISYAYLGFVTPEVLQWGLLIGVVSIAGNYVGKRILGNISDALFKKAVVLTMVVSGIMMLWRHSELISTLTNRLYAAVIL